MRLTIIPADGFVSVDGVGYLGLPITTQEGVHAIQWQESSGWVEYKEIDGVKQSNEPITSIDTFSDAIEIWQRAHDAALADEAEKNRPPTLEEIRRAMVVTPFQAKTALLDAGFLDDIELMVADPATDRKVVLAWNNALSFERLSPMVASFAGALGWSDEQLDALFIAAAEIE